MPSTDAAAAAVAAADCYSPPSSSFDVVVAAVVAVVVVVVVLLLPFSPLLPPLPNEKRWKVPTDSIMDIGSNALLLGIVLVCIGRSPRVVWITATLGLCGGNFQ
jgi:hypothetical protein